MEAKAKSGATAPKAAPKVEKKEPAASRKADPAPAAPAAPEVPAAPEPELPPAQDGAAEAEAEAEAAGDEAAASGTDSLEHLKPFLIGGAVIAAGAILLGVLLLARRN
ncbi:Cell cycle exit and neuronal differentiation protein 1 [Dissostichus eleginoides]|uniref:Cell cycle exit and neuronal differentiation protein 1 n=1 Tax=Dissostichus eleginoides TaxID=100907 RepID=A0AAD9BVZ3_DISEL|nr:Cell cycle exit and neuronal differentiation protein 1 [Dissostichus eleginoides]